MVPSPRASARPFSRRVRHERAAGGKGGAGHRRWYRDRRGNLRAAGHRRGDGDDRPAYPGRAGAGPGCAPARRSRDRRCGRRPRHRRRLPGTGRRLPGAARSHRHPRQQRGRHRSAGRRPVPGQRRPAPRRGDRSQSEGGLPLRPGGRPPHGGRRRRRHREHCVGGRACGTDRCRRLRRVQGRPGRTHPLAGL